MPRVVTFYSFKGGVGRTMSLVNVAHLLARDGFRVLLVDFDLEAPGMTHYFAKQVKQGQTPTSRDALDLLLDAKATCGVDRPADGPFVPVSLADFVISLAVPKKRETEDDDSVAARYLRGRLDFIPATLDVENLGPGSPAEGYLDRLADLDLPGIFGPDGPGHRFGRHLRKLFDDARFDVEGDPLRTLRERVHAAYDLVLVDSRTGLNEASGLSIGPLCDALVVCTGLNEQNVEGTRYFLQNAGLFDDKAKQYRVVVGPVPPWSTEAVERRIKKVERSLHIKDPVRIPYHPAAALGEPIFVVDLPGEAIGVAYEAFAEQLRRMVAPEPLRIADLVKLDWNERFRVFIEALPWMRQSVAWGLREEFEDVVTAAPFPTAVLMMADRRGWFWHYAAPAAVAAYTRRMTAPLEEAWHDVLSAKSRDALASWIVMRLRLAVHLPLTDDERARVREILGAKRISRHRRQFANAVVYARSVGIIEDADEQEGTARHTRIFSLPLAHIFETSAQEGELFRAGVSARPGKSLRHFLRNSAEVLADASRNSAVVAEMGTDWYRWPFSPVALVTGLVALAKGQGAIDEVLGWISLTQRVHGYAWRVLVDWRHLASVREHPKFAAFVADEDARVAAIEAEIDSGRYPL